MAGILVNQVFAIAFIIGICVVNFFLIFKVSQNKYFMYSHKRLTLISLACGDVFLSVFSLMLTVIELFGQQIDDCTSSKASFVYQRFILPFVFAAGLVVLVIQKMFKEKIGSPVPHTSDLLKAIAVSTLPWILGLFIILPITGDEDKWETCDNYSHAIRFKGVFVGCVIFPSTVALLTCCITLCIAEAQMQDNNQDKKALISKTPNTPLHFLNSPEFNEGTPIMKIMTCENLLENKYSDSKNHQHDTCNGEYKQLNKDTGLSAPKFLPLSNTQNEDSPENIFKNSSKGKYVLLLVSFINFICVVPLAGLLLGHNHNMAALNKKIISDLLVFCFYWLSVSRSFITPLIWICSRK